MISLLQKFTAQSTHRARQLRQVKKVNFNLFSTSEPNVAADDGATVDTLIIGGGPMGSSTAFHLSTIQQQQGMTKVGNKGDDLQQQNQRIVVLERDPTYKSSSAVLSAGGIRQQFSLKENVLMSLYSLDFLRNSSTLLSREGENEVVDVQFVEGGYLFLASTKEGVKQMKDNFKVQRDAGCTASRLLSRDQLKKEFPWLHVDDILLGSHSESGEGWFDPWLYIKALKDKNRQNGVSYIHAEPVGSTRDPETGRIVSVDIKNYEMNGQIQKVKVNNVVNASGANASSLTNLLAGESHPLSYMLPVKPRKRCLFFFHCQPENTNSDDIGNDQPVIPEFAPLTVDTSKVYFRSEGEKGSGNFLCGVSPPSDNDPDCFNPRELENADHELYYDIIWPALFHRVPAFGNSKVMSSWAGLYEYNTVDQNAIIDFHPEMDNLLLLNGFSGHGLMHSPAAGRAAAELLTNENKFATLDLDAFRFDRCMDGGTPVYERGIF